MKSFQALTFSVLASFAMVSIGAADDGLFAQKGGISIQRQRENPPARRENPPTRQNDPPARQSDPPARRSDPPARRESPPSRQENPPARRENPPSRVDPGNQRQTPPARQENPPARRENPPSRVDPGNQRQTPPTRQENPPARRQNPPSRVDPGNQRQTPPTRQENPPARRENPPSRVDPGNQRQTPPTRQENPPTRRENPPSRVDPGNQRQTPPTRQENPPARRENPPSRVSPGKQNGNPPARTSPGTRSGSGNGRDAGNREIPNRGVGGDGLLKSRSARDSSSNNTRTSRETPTRSQGNNNLRAANERTRAIDIHYPEANRTSRGARRDADVRTVYRQGYYSYRNDWCDDWFLYPYYRFDYYDNYVCSPWYLYPHMPGYVDSFRISFSIPHFRFVYTTYSYNYRNYEVNRYDSNYELNETLRGITRLYRDRNYDELDYLVPNDYSVVIRDQNAQPYVLNSNDFYDMVADAVYTTDTSDYRIIHSSYGRGGARVVARHTFKDPWNRKTSVYHTYILERVNSRYRIAEFGTYSYDPW